MRGLYITQRDQPRQNLHSLGGPGTDSAYILYRQRTSRMTLHNLCGTYTTCTYYHAEVAGSGPGRAGSGPCRAGSGPCRAGSSPCRAVSGPPTICTHKTFKHLTRFARPLTALCNPYTTCADHTTSASELWQFKRTVRPFENAMRSVRGFSCLVGSIPALHQVNCVRGPRVGIPTRHARHGRVFAA